MNHTSEQIKEAARYRWRGILQQMGIPARALTGKHTACPVCGGKDRFRFDDQEGRGTFICGQHGAGDGIRLIMDLHQCNFQTALSRLAACLGMAAHTPPEYQPPKHEPKQEPPEKDKAAKLAALWHEAKPVKQGDPVYSYLQGRGLAMAEPPQNIRYHETLPYWVETSNGWQIHTRAPAMLAAIHNTAGELQGLHLTYLKPCYAKPHGDNGNHIPSYTKLNIRHPDTGEPLPAKKMQSRISGSTKGAAVQLYPLAEAEPRRLLVCEGIETALAARELFPDYPVWACLNAGNLAAFQIPPEVTELLIVADHDTPRPVGFKAAHDLAVRAIKSGVRAGIWQPETQGYDALDELERRKRPAYHTMQHLRESKA
ncbi:DUF7146 domain-containing protein [Bergeriella denitrificans]|uniref:Putative prophage DNA primase n=1 Tax=Bergeriella denitrificans TaxID=494 RepID=A0A378UI79_BERDE|nr:toprim domain-containing protein [Bergeriella denitrificans]STZ76860.1 putative prophage DNA primase [Bergeriella denitrificans]